MKVNLSILKNLTIFMVTVAAYAMAVIGCEKSRSESIPPDVKTEQAVFFLPDSCLEVSASGGNVRIVYVLENAAEEYSIVPEYEAEWLDRFDFSSKNTISFAVDQNSDDISREAQVYFVYFSEKDTVSDVLTITQRGIESIPEFEFDIVRKTDCSISFSVVSRDKNMPYIAMLTERAYMDSFSTDEQFIEDELMIFNMLASSQGLSLEEFLGLRLLTGDTDSINVSGLEPETEYCLYAHGMDVKGNALTDLHKYYASTETTELLGITFEISTDVHGTDVTLGIRPSDPEQMYIFDAFKTETVPDGYALEEFFQEYIDGQIAFYTQFGLSAESAVSQISHTGNATSKAELEAVTDYICIVTSVNKMGIVNSLASSSVFTTGEVMPSDNVIEIKVTDVGERSAAFTLLPSNEDSYIFIVDKAENWKNLTLDEISENLRSVAGISPDRFTGVHDGIADVLLPETEYVIIAAGWVQGVITTVPFMKYFITKEAPVSDVTFRLLYDKYFDCDELSSYYPGYSGLSGFVAVPAEVETTGDVSSYIYHLFRGDLMDQAEWPDNRAIDTLLHVNIPDAPETVFFATYDVEYTFLGVAIDTKGNYGKVFRGRFLPVRDGVSPVEEFDK